MSDEPATLLASGQAHEARGEFSAALACYDAAIAGLRALPAGLNENRRALGVAWMNRGNALQKIADIASLAAAVHAYDEAIAVLRTLSVETNPAHRNHLGAAWVNRGHTQLGAGDVPGAVASFEQAIAILATLPLDDSPYYRLNLAGAWTNLAHALLTTPPTATRPVPLERACVAARNALHFVHDAESRHAAFAEMSLRARRALVAALGERLVGADATTALATEASDVIDDGLALARAWETRGLAQLRPLALRLFRMGAQLYGVHQPHFLGEFVRENLATPAFAADAEFRAAAREAIEQALAVVHRPQLLVAGTPDAEKLLATARSLRAVQQELSTPPA